jgi:hypothetical protein
VRSLGGTPFRIKTSCFLSYVLSFLPFQFGEASATGDFSLDHSAVNTPEEAPPMRSLDEGSGRDIVAEGGEGGGGVRGVGRARAGDGERRADEADGE